MRKSRGKTVVEIRPTAVEYAQANYANRVTPLPVTEETQALELLTAEWRRQQLLQGQESSRQVLNIEINNFEIYHSLDSSKYAYVMKPLHHFDIKAKALSISGVLSLGDVSTFVEDVPIFDYSVEGYDDAEDPSTAVYVQPQGALEQDAEIWFLLKRPAKNYRTFHEPFEWVTNFGKHVVDFLAQVQNVHLSHFGEVFNTWLSNRFAQNAEFITWQKAFGQTDYRVAVHAYSDYLYNQACNLSNARALLRHPVWAECLKGNATAIEEHPLRSKTTIATLIVYRCFKQMSFGGYLEETQLQEAVQKEQEARKKELGFALDTPSYGKKEHLPAVAPSLSCRYHVGDVVAVKQDEAGVWDTVTNKEWVAYVTKVEQVQHQQGLQRLFVLWLYRPEDTTISTMIYPNNREMFMSDHCNCTDAHLVSTDVIRELSVDWRPKSTYTRKDIFVRQKYVTQESSFVTLQDSDFLCMCHQKPASSITRYHTGDTVYIKTGKSLKTLEPVVVCNWDSTTGSVEVRRLLRLEKISAIIQDDWNLRRAVAPAVNEVAWSDKVFTVSASRVERRCHVRYFPLEDIITCQIPTPYDLRGNGDYWYMSSQITEGHLDEQGQIRPYLLQLTAPPKPLNQGFNPLSPSSLPPLRGLSIFSGGGNLDRGLEEGGAVKFTGAVDISKEAVHTQLANATHPEFKVYWGSVDDYLKGVLQPQGLPDSELKYIARIGEVEFLAGGSPCQAFSTMQPNRLSDRSLGNASHVTTFCSFVDVFRPEYALLENVVALANSRKGSENEKIFSQLIGCLVAMGYQVQQYLMDAWSHSSAQGRTRLFISIAAPGLEPLRKPYLTHSHPSFIRNRSLGKLVTKMAFGSREFPATPFEYTTPGELSGELPNIGSGLNQTCIPFPDHRVEFILNNIDRALVKRVPVTLHGQGRGKGYAEALALGLIPQGLVKTHHHYKVPGRVFRRLNPNRLYSTMATMLSPHDTRGGDNYHWEQHRTLTVQEARDAQGIPDHEVIIGKIRDQHKVIGNGVDRNLALALGLSLRQAIETNDDEQSFSADCLPEDARGDPNSGSDTPAPDSVARTTHFLAPTTDFLAPTTGCLAPTTGSEVSTTSGELEALEQDTRETTVSTATIGGIRVKRVRETSSTAMSTASRKSKKTRHSGLQVEFVPERWDKAPEKTLKRER